MARDQSTAFVLFASGPPKNWRRAAAILDQASPTLVRADATFACRHGGGFVPHALPNHEAQHVAGELSAAGFPAIAVAADRMVWAPPAHTIQFAEVREAGFAIRADWLEHMRLVPWSWIRAIAAVPILLGGTSRPLAHVQQSRRTCPPPDAEPGSREAPLLTREDLVDAAIGLTSAALSFVLPIPFGEALDVARLATRIQRAEPAEPMFPTDPQPPQRAPTSEARLEIFCIDPLVRLRTRHDAFDYSGLGGRTATTGRANFVRLVEAVRRHLPGCASLGDVNQPRRVVMSLAPEQALEERLHELAATALLTRISLGERSSD